MFAVEKSVVNISGGNFSILNFNNYKKTGGKKCERSNWADIPIG